MKMLKSFIFSTAIFLPSIFEAVVDPPPDLVIEVDVTNTALSKFPVYAHFGVPEIWRYDGQRVAIFRLTGGEYVESETSVAFPGVYNADLSHFLEQAKCLKRTAWLGLVRSWARERRDG